MQGLILIILFFLDLTWAQNIQICPSNDMTLNCLRMNSSMLHKISSNSSLILLPGYHELNSTIVIEGVRNVTLIGSPETMTVRSEALAVYGLPMIAGSTFAFSAHVSIVNCTPSGGLSFFNVFRLTVVNVTFVGCGAPSAVNVVNGTGVFLEGITVINSFSVGLHMEGVSGNSSLVSSTIAGSQSGLVLLASSLTVVRSTFAMCNYSFTANASSAQCLGCEFKYNRRGLTASEAAGGTSGSNITLSDTSFKNSVRGAVFKNSMVSLLNCEYSYTRFGVTVTGGTAAIEGTTFTNGYLPLFAIKASLALKGVSISRNTNGGISAIQSEVTLTGDVTLSNNDVVDGYGGALRLLSSVVYLSAPATVSFSNNTAMIGGAVYVKPSTRFNFESITFERCIFQVRDSIGNLSSPAVRLVFSNNKAGLGAAVFANVKICTLEQSPSMNYNNTDPMTLFKAISAGISYPGVNISYPGAEKGDIQYEPLGVTLCPYGQADGLGAKTTSMAVTVYPGAAQLVWVTAIDIYGNAVPAAVFTRTNSYVRLSYFVISNACYPYSISSTEVVAGNSSVNLYFGLEMSNYGMPLEFETETPTTYVTVNKVLPCPIGFMYNGSVCKCSPFLLLSGVLCNLTEQSFTRGGNAYTWIGLRTGGGGGGGNGSSPVLAYASDCPIQYCSSKLDVPKVYVTDLSSPMCRFNRSGPLCGGCSEGLSETFGQSRCTSCDNSGLAFLALYAGLGALLVVLIFALDLNVSKGTINEFIFYISVLNINNPSFFTFDIYFNPFVRFLYVFVSWMNLDIGMELCFYDGMDNYQKAWLQFSFPLYLLAIVGAIVLASRCSWRVAALCGNSVVPALATIVLLSYTKVLVNVINIFLFADIFNAATGDRYRVWYFDGSIRYLEGRHIPLCVFGLVVSVVFLVPYTFVALFSPWLQKKSHVRGLGWVNRLTPFIDSYQAPFNEHIRFWTGLLLLVRILLSVVSYIPVPDNALRMVEIAVVLVVLFTVLLFCRVYKSIYLQALGSFFYLNMIFVCISMTYMNENQSGVNFSFALSILMSISGGSVFVCFIGIVIFHVWKKIVNCIKPPSSSKAVPPNDFEMMPTERNDENCELRESLLM